VRSTKQDDITNSFRNSRQVHVRTTWIFDLIEDIVLFEKKDQILPAVPRDFHIVEINDFRRGIGGRLVNIQDLPKWEPFDQFIARVGRASVVLYRDLERCVAFVREDVERQRGVALKHSNTAYNLYVMLLTRHLLLCSVDSEGTHFEIYPPEIFFKAVIHPLREQSICLLRILFENFGHAGAWPLVRVIGHDDS
jgi:hypothetical protein